MVFMVELKTIDGCVKYVVSIVKHPFVSITVTIYCPPDNPEISSVVAVNKLFGYSHKYVKPGVPPITVISITPVLSSAQLSIV